MSERVTWSKNICLKSLKMLITDKHFDIAKTVTFLPSLSNQKKTIMTLIIKSFDLAFISSHSFIDFRSTATDLASQCSYYWSPNNLSHCHHTHDDYPDHLHDHHDHHNHHLLFSRMLNVAQKSIDINIV